LNNISKILIVVDSINIEDSSGSKANVALINNLVEAGFEVLVYHYTQKDIQLPRVFCYAISEIKWSFCYFLSRFQRVIQRNFNIEVATSLEQLFGFSFTFFNDTNSIAKALKKQTFQPDLILTLSIAASFRPHYAILKLPQLHNKWMAYIHDPYPFQYYPRPYNWIQPGYKQKEDFFLKVSEKARYSGFPSLLLKEWMGSYFSNFLKTGTIIPHQLVEYTSGENKLPVYFKKDAFTILHAGNLMKQRDPKFLLKAYQLFLEKYPEAKAETQLLLIGPAGYHEVVIEEYVSRISNLIFIGEKLSFNEVLAMQNQASVNVILESKSEISPFLPAKFPHCVLSNNAILLLGPYYSESKRLLGVDYPYWSEADDSMNIEKLISQMYFSWKENKSILKLNRPDLKFYMSISQLKKSITEL
jgi:glycosyltransferase involved in cell wall biosynthesis